MTTTHSSGPSPTTPNSSCSTRSGAQRPSGSRSPGPNPDRAAYPMCVMPLPSRSSKHRCAQLTQASRCTPTPTSTSTTSPDASVSSSTFSDRPWLPTASSVSTAAAYACTSSATSATAPSPSRWTSYRWWHASPRWCLRPGKTKSDIQAYWHRHTLGARQWCPTSPMRPTSLADTQSKCATPTPTTLPRFPRARGAAIGRGAYSRPAPSALTPRNLVQDRDAIERILTHLGLPTDVPKPAPARGPPYYRGRVRRVRPDGPQQQLLP